MFLVLFCGPAQAQTLTLEQTWDSALAHSDDLETIRASVLRARAGRRRALAAMLPSLTASGRFRLNEEAVSLGGQTLRPQTEVSGSLVVDLGIFDGRAWPTFSAAGQQIQLARLRLEDARSLVLVDVAGTYYTALALRQLLNVAKGAVASRQKHLEAAEARLEAGHAVRLDVERARAAVHRADRDRIDTEHRVESARDALAIAMGIEPPLVGRLIRPAAAKAPVMTETAALARARDGRLDLAALRGQIQAIDTLSWSPWMSAVPRLSLQGRVDLSEVTLNNPNTTTPSLAFNLTWALFDGGARYADMMDNDASMQEARASLRKADRQLRSQIREAQRSLLKGQAILQAARAERAAASRAAEAADESFRAGNATGLDVIDARLELENTEATLIREELSLDLSRLSLLRALGDLNPAN